MSILISVMLSFTFSLFKVAVCDPNTLSVGGWPLAPGVLWKLDVCAGIKKFGALFAKNGGGGGGEEVPLNLLSLFWSSYSLGTGGRRN